MDRFKEDFEGFCNRFRAFLDESAAGVVEEEVVKDFEVLRTEMGRFFAEASCSVPDIMGAVGSAWNALEELCWALDFYTEETRDFHKYGIGNALAQIGENIDAYWKVQSIRLYPRDEVNTVAWNTKRLLAQLADDIGIALQRPNTDTESLVSRAMEIRRVIVRDIPQLPSLDKEFATVIDLLRAAPGYVEDLCSIYGEAAEVSEKFVSLISSLGIELAGEAESWSQGK